MTKTKIEYDNIPEMIELLRLATKRYFHRLTSNNNAKSGFEFEFIVTNEASKPSKVEILNIYRICLKRYDKEWSVHLSDRTAENILTKEFTDKEAFCRILHDIETIVDTDIVRAQNKEWGYT